MEFWAVEVKSGEPVKVEPGEDMVLHLSQVSLGECKKEKGNESVCLFLHVDGKKLVLATLFSDKLPQQQLDLVFDKDFELSHNWKNGNVYFYGYKTQSPFEDEDDVMGDFGDSDSEEEIPLTRADNGKLESKVKEEKPAEVKVANAEKDSGASKQKVKIVEPNRDSIPKNEEDDDSSDEDDSMSEDEDGSMDEDEDESDSDEDNESDESDEEETPKKVETGKKRAANSAVKTPGQDKKAKLTTPQKTDGKKGGGHVATPYPSKPAGKTPANKNQQTPKSVGGSHACKSCNKTFNSEAAVESHTKAKHSGGK